MTESFAELFERSQQTLAKLKPGAIVMGTVVEIRSDVVVINAGLKSEGIVPIEQFPAVVQWTMQLTPLYHAVALLRQLTIGAVTPAIAGHLAYLIIGGATAFGVAMYRLERKLIK